MVRNLMDKVGVDFFADIHGDEELPYNFISGSEGIPSWDDRLEGRHLANTYLCCSIDATGGSL